MDICVNESDGKVRIVTGGNDSKFIIWKDVT
jgi:hypothetical protein